MPRFFGRMFVAGTKPKRRPKPTIKKLRSSSGAVLIATDADGKADWVRRRARVPAHGAADDLDGDQIGAAQPAPSKLHRCAPNSGRPPVGAGWPQLLMRFGRAADLLAPRAVRWKMCWPDYLVRNRVGGSTPWNYYIEEAQWSTLLIESKEEYNH